MFISFGDRFFGDIYDSYCGERKAHTENLRTDLAKKTSAEKFCFSLHFSLRFRFSRANLS